MNTNYCLQAAIAFVLYLIASSPAVAFGQSEPAARGGDALVCDTNSDHSKQNSLSAARKEIVNFLKSSNDTGCFHIQGWRWHTMSLLREADRLRQLAQRWERESPDKNDFSALKQATDYVVGFNMKGLHKIERSLFFPWAREKTNAMTNPKVAQAFGAVMDELEKDCRTIEKLGAAMVKDVAKASTSIRPKDRLHAIKSVETKSSKITDHVRSMLALEESLLVPLIARVVPEPDQKSFNSRVIRNLGVFDSRLHLVGMHEAVTESKNVKEIKLFEEVIPSIPRKLIPRWKRLLYQPQAGVLDLL